MQRLLVGGVEAGAVGALDPERITRHERLAEGDEPAALPGGRPHVLDDLGERGLSVQEHRRHLGESDLQYRRRIALGHAVV
jgi:hypothetical protein